MIGLGMGRNRTVLAVIAIIAILLGMLLVGGTPQSASYVPPSSVKTPLQAGDATEDQVDSFAVREYTEFTDASGPDLPSTDSLGILGGLGLKLAFVVVLIYAALWAYRRYVYRGRTTGSSKSVVALLGSLTLAPTGTVHVLEVGRKILVVGATSSQLSLLTEVTEPEALDEMRALSADTPLPGQFSSLFAAFNRQLSAKPRTPSAPLDV